MSDSGPDAVTPFVKKPGQAIAIQSYQVDEDGYALSRITGEWFGFSNTEANVISFGLNDAVEQYIQSLADAKAAGAAPPGHTKKA
jgi:hypothetical protein